MPGRAGVAPAVLQPHVLQLQLAGEHHPVFPLEWEEEEGERKGVRRREGNQREERGKRGELIIIMARYYGCYSPS